MLSPSIFRAIIARDGNSKCKVVFVSDCITGGSVFDISQVNNVNRKDTSDMISFSVNKSTDPNSKDGRKSHDIFTYYFSKIIYDDPSISAQRLVEILANKHIDINISWSFWHISFMQLNKSSNHE